MHAVGHASSAFTAGAGAVLLAQAWGIRTVHATPLVGRAAPSDQAFLLSGIGMMAVLVKGGGRCVRLVRSGADGGRGGK
jgi:hypothetical protein